MTKEYILQILNEAFEADAPAIQSLFCSQVPVNEKLSEHPTIPVHSRPSLNGTMATIGFLDIVNGFLTESGQHIVYKWSDIVNEHGQRTLIGFQLADLVSSNQ